MEDKDYIKDLFSQKLGNYEANVNPQLWDKIASQVTVGATTASTAVGTSIFTKWMIGLGVSAVFTTAVVVLSNQSTEETTKSPDLEVKVETNSSKNEELPVSELSAERTDNVGQRELVTGSVQRNEVETHRSSSEVKPFTFNNLSLQTATLFDRDHLIDFREIQEVVAPIIGDVVSNPNSEEAGIADPEADSPEVPEVVGDYWIEKLPDVFTPNNDGVNDVFLINSKGLLDFNIVILDKTSQAIFTSSDPNFRWSGLTRTGEPAADGNYVYFITAKDSKGTNIKEFSTLSVTRESR